MHYEPIIELIRQWERYEAAAKTPDLQDFARWMLRNSPLPENKGQVAPQTSSRTQATYEQLPPEVSLNVLLHRLQKKWEIGSKSLFAESFAIRNLSELRILACVASKNLPKKNEVIGELLFETTTGTMLIQRLVERGLLTESPDTQDRRAVRLRATESGIAALQGINAPAFEMMRIFFAPLDDGEKRQLVEWLLRLDTPEM